MKIKERLEINDALVELVNLFAKWGLKNNDYVLVDEFAYVLQDYDISGKEVEAGHLDVYVDFTKLPWKDKRERSIIPPKDSSYVEDWMRFMKNTGYALDMLRAKSEIFQVPMVGYKLPNKRIIRLMRAYEMTNAFVDRTLMHYSLDDVGKDKIKEWMDKLKLIECAAEKKGDFRLGKLCGARHKEAANKWEFGGS